MAAASPNAATNRDRSTDPGLVGRTRAAIASCRTRQHELSLILLEIDNYENLLVMYGPDKMVQIVAGMRRAIQDISDMPCECLIVSDTRVAVILPDCERRHAVSLGRSLNDAVPVWMLEQGEVDAALTFSIGIASLTNPSPSARPDDLIDAADRCLFAAKRSGGCVIKSIDVL